MHESIEYRPDPIASTIALCDSPDGTSSKITKNEAENISTVTGTLDDIEDENCHTIDTWVGVYSPVLDEAAVNWRFKYNDRNEHMDISETNIADMAIKRGSIGVNDRYKVSLEIKQKLSSSGKITYSYKIIELLEFKPAMDRAQSSLFDE